jgi:hypothetical protein
MTTVRLQAISFVEFIDKFSGRHTAHGTWHTAHRTWPMAHCTRHVARATLHMALTHGTLYTAHGTWHTVHCTWHTAQVPQQLMLSLQEDSTAAALTPALTSKHGRKCQ